MEKGKWHMDIWKREQEFDETLYDNVDNGDIIDKETWPGI